MTKRKKDSLTLSFAIISGLATVFTVLGLSLKDLMPFKCVQPAFLAVIIRAAILLFVYALLAYLIWLIIGYIYRDTIKLKIGNNDVTIKPGDIFDQDAWRVIAVDTHFSTNVDDVEISRTSLHGQLVLDYGEAEGIEEAVKKEAIRRKIKQGSNGRYTFPLGTAIHYEGKNDRHYIMVALTDLDADNEAHTRMALYESTLMNIWREISRVYAKNDLALPILGAGITRFDDGQDDPATLLRCMLCTLNTSKVHFKSNVSIVVYDGENKGELDKNDNNTEEKSNISGDKAVTYAESHESRDTVQKRGNKLTERKKTKKNNSLPLYEYKDMFRIVR